MPKPHVVIIMADQLRHDVCTPQYTPAIHRLSEEGVVFERAYCASPLCVPARGAFFTGKYPNQTGCIINPWEDVERQHGVVRSGTANLYQLLEGAWDSWHCGKQHLLTDEKRPAAATRWNTEHDYGAFLKNNGHRKPGGAAFTGICPEMFGGRITRMRRYSIPTTGCYEHGFDSFFDGYIASSALSALRQRDRSKPFLLNAMFLAPHPPLDIPQPWYSLYKDAVLPRNVGVWSPNQSPLQLYNLPGALGARYTRDDWQKIWPVYLGLVTLLDHCVALLLNELKAQGMYDDTLIVFTADHGEMLGSHCLWQKMCMYEESVRTPLFIKFPRSFQPAARKIRDVASAVDVLPTLCEFLEVPAPSGLAGQSLMPAVRGEGLKPREGIYVQFDGNGARGNFQRCVIDGDSKLIVDMFKDETFLELYNVTADPEEMNNLAFDPAHGERIEAMLARLRAWMRDTGDLLQISENAYSRFVADYAPFSRL
ncbi:MAG TPA: sulfatase-like hydrolase/transferase [Planctomycetota bacterium]|nr:sulfatase-like hydrolase/transferase [Planctomycetota bacterium]